MEKSLSEVAVDLVAAASIGDSASCDAALSKATSEDISATDSVNLLFFLSHKSTDLFNRQHGRTALHLAALNQQVEQVHSLIAAKAEVELEDKAP